ncbi:signal peptidase I [Streptobacillus felis]|uniref:signal peptidase I n=1 Tax=Streptobacillus felis TaxID=1384509 RepID=UPI00082E9978|nr:signal peptidase I [Streptobacillus felis]
MKYIKRICLTVFILIILIFSNIKINISESSPIGIYLINRFSKTYKKGDYIIYKINDKYRQYIKTNQSKLDTVKQIKGIKGDEIEYIDNYLYINKEKIAEIIYDIEINAKQKYTIPENEVLTIGEVDESIDGRYYGTIKEKDIKYKVYLIYRFKR